MTLLSMSGISPQELRDKPQTVGGKMVILEQLMITTEVAEKKLESPSMD